jgi:hypothetical protein
MKPPRCPDMGKIDPKEHAMELDGALLNITRTTEPPTP